MGRPKRIAAKRATERLKSSIADSGGEDDYIEEINLLTPTKSTRSEIFHMPPSRPGRPPKNPFASLKLNRDKLMLAVTAVAVTAQDPLAVIREQDVSVFNSLEIIEKIMRYSRRNNKQKSELHNPVKVKKVESPVRKMITRKSHTTKHEEIPPGTLLTFN